MENRVEYCISVQQMAERIGVSKARAYQLVNSADFYPAIRIGKRVLINTQSLQRWLGEQSNNAGA